tara:strand:+ start:85 stop:285 length:201 start_codon:yes stop_codon:yes gene_type:complete
MSGGPVVYGNVNFGVGEVEKWTIKDPYARHRLSQFEALRRAIALLVRELVNRGHNALRTRDLNDMD